MPGKYESHIKPNLEKIAKWKKSGMTDARICKKLKVSNNIFIKYQKEHEEFKAIIDQAKQNLSDEIENSLFRRAKGYDYEEVRTIRDESGKITRTETFKRHMPGDPKAMAMSLSALKREKYKYFEIEKLKLEKLKLELLREKAIPQTDYDMINNNITNIAELLMHPVPPRKPKLETIK